MDMIGDMDLNSYFNELAQNFGDKTAVVFENGDENLISLSYNELNQQINKAANLLLSNGIKQGDFIALHLRNGIDFVLGFFATCKIGAIAVPINAHFLQNDAWFMIKKTKPKLLITKDEFVEIYSDKICNDMKILTDFANQLDGYSHNLDIIKVDNLKPAEIIFTSGASSFPKGVVITHYNLIFAGHYSSWQININSDDRFLTAMPLWHIDAQCTVMMPTFTRGATLVLAHKYSASRFWSWVLKHKITITECIPKMICTLMLQKISPDEKNHNLREMLFYLNISQSDLDIFLDRFNIKSVLTSYGMSETVVGLITDRPFEKRKFPSIGRVGFCYEAKIVDEEANELPPFKHGEIWIKGDRGKSIFDGYFDDEEATKKTLSNDGWLRTGDIGYVDNSGYFYFVDRNINLIKVAGENVSSVEVENYISSHDKVLEVAVFGVEDECCGEIVKACVVLKNGEILKQDELIQYCKDGLAKFKVPSVIEFYEYLPKTSTGKVKKGLLKG